MADFPIVLSNVIAEVSEIKAIHINNLEAKVGIDASAVVTSLDYLLKNSASINPGHKHSKLWASGGAPEAITVDATGNVGIGTTSPATKLHLAETIITSPRGLMSSQHNAGDDGARLHLRKSRGTLASPAVIVTGDNLGRLVASGYDGAAYQEMAGITFGTEGTIGANQVPTYLAFFTATNASPSVLTERMRITAAGNVGIGTTSPDAAALLHLVSTTKGFLPPVLTTTQKAAISTPPEGLIVYDATLHAPGFYNASAWKTVAYLESPAFTTPNIGVGAGTSLALSGGFGCNGKAIQTAYASGGALAGYATGAYGLDTATNMQAMFNLVVAMRAALVANGIMS